MKLVLLDLGNSRLKGGIFFADQLSRITVLPLKQWTDETCFDWLQQHYPMEGVEGVVISSVVPSKTVVLEKACKNFFSTRVIVLDSDGYIGSRGYIELCCDNPSEVGSDRVAAFLGARDKFPDLAFNLLVFDCGTATTAGLVNTRNQFVGGLIAPGLDLALEALTTKAEQLRDLSIPLIKPSKILGTNTVDNIQSGLYYSALGLMKEVIAEVKIQGPCRVIGTGGLSELFKDEGVFDFHEPHLVLWGLVAFWKKSQGENHGGRA